MTTYRQDDILGLVKKRTVLFDGALGTTLMAEGLPSGDLPERWNLEAPEKVKSVHKRYFEAGSDVVLTNSFGANRLKLKKKNLDRDVFQLNTQGAQLAKAVRPPHRFVAGDMGPSGELIAPLGTVTAQEMEEIFAEQAKALASGEVDLIIVETMFSLQEALAALRGVRKVTDCPLFVSLTYESKNRGYFTMMGETPEVCAKALESEGVDVVGANCTLGSREMIPLARVLRDATSLPVIIQPNAGKPRLKDGETIYDQDPEEFADDVQAIVEEGVNLVGGCCGTTPKFISALHRRLFDR